MNPSLPASRSALARFLQSTAAAAWLALAAPALAVPSGGAPMGVNEIVSLAHDGSLGTERCSYPAMSPDGRWVAFQTRSALVPEDVNGLWDIYAFDRQTGTLHAVSTPTGGGVFGNANSYFPSISADGRYVVYESGSDNLAPLDFNTWLDVYMKDLQTGVTTRISNSAGTGEAADGASRRPSISADGRYVAFRSSADDLGVPDTNFMSDIYRYDNLTGDVVRVSDGPAGQANGNSIRPSISADGSRIAFRSWASNLVPGDANGYADIFAVDVGGLPVLVSRTPAGAAPDSESSNAKISGDGSHVSFVSWASDMAGPPGDVELDVFVTDLDTLTVEMVSVFPDGGPSGDGSHDQSISYDGRYVAFTGFANGYAPFESPHFDIFVRDMVEGVTWTAGRPDGLVLTADAGTGTPVLSADGMTIAFVGVASNLIPGFVDDNDQWDIFVREMQPAPKGQRPAIPLPGQAP